ncbi:MAG: TIGR01244 family sulfur transferase [Sphingomicrobium sp.]
MRPLDDKTLVSGQIEPQEMLDIKRLGVTMIVNNRPDGEDPDQPTSAEIEQAAAVAGLEYRHIPIWRGPGPAEIEQIREAIDDCREGKLLLFCRSGTRSTFGWAVAQAENGRSRDELERCAQEAGYDLGPVAHLL